MAAKWISSNPHSFLEKAHQNPAFGRPRDWETDYAPWRYGYAPGFRERALEVFPDSACSDFQKVMAPLVPVAAALIPVDLKTKIARVQQDEWTSLPDEQIRHAWNTSNMCFSKIVLALAALQIAILLRAGRLKTPVELKGEALAYQAELIAELENLEDIGTPDLMKDTKVHLATYAFSVTDGDFWKKQVAEVTEIAEDFREFTGQYHPTFLLSLADGELATIQSLQSIQAWCTKKFPDKNLGRIFYVHKDQREVRRVRAAKKESVRITIDAGPADEATAETPPES